MSKLFLPVTFRCGATVPNAVALAPLTNQQSHADGTLSDDELRWIVRRAEGGFGLVETCAAHVSRDGQAFDGQLGAWDDRHLPGLRTLATEIASHGALAVMQLHHGGARSLSRLTGTPTWSASTFTEDRPGFEPPRPATEQDIERALGDFERATVRAKDAGFGGVELHGAHGYLLGQFLSVTMNTRTDGWGGSLENRARLIRTATQRARAAAPAPFVLGVRLSPENFGQAHGLDLDESVRVARWLADDGADFVHLSLWDVIRHTTKRPSEHPIPLFRRALPRDVRIVVAGKIWDAKDAEDALALGADIVSLGRAAILDPDWPKHAREPGFEPERGPLTPERLRALAISDAFVDYLRRFKTIVRDA